MSLFKRPAGRHGSATSPRPWAAWGQTLARQFVRHAPWLLGAGVAAALSAALLVATVWAIAWPNLPDISSLTDYRPRLPMRIYSADGVLLGEFGEERRSFTPIAQIPRTLQDAVLATEDARFREHGGVHYKGVLRAAFAHLTKSRSQGASTITMQVARNFYLPTHKTYTRKLYEMLLAVKIESELGKDQILEIYMNQIHLGQHAYGFASASEIYFGKPLGELNLAETAMLAGLPQSPNLANPITNPTRAMARQRHVLDRMLHHGHISARQHDEARTQALTFRARSELPAHADHVAEAARQLVFSQYGPEAYSRGLNVHLTIASADQQAAYRALRKGIMDFERRQPYRGPEDYVDLPRDPGELDARVADALADHPDNDELKAAVALEAGPAKVVAMLQSGESVSVTGEGLKQAAPGLSDKAAPRTQIRRGAVIRLVQGHQGTWTITQLPEVEGAFVAMDPRSGAVRAMVGGFDHSKSKFNRVTQAWRQPGSTIKPFIYSAALEQGLTPATLINDAPLMLDSAATGGVPWEPRNSDGKFDGPMSLRTALAQSKNMVSIRILQAIGAPYAQDWLTRFGFDAERHPAYLTMALGSGSVTPLQMASAYSVLANGGYRLNPVLISRLTDSKGRVLNETQMPQLDESLRAVDARNAFVMNSLLQEVTSTGTAKRAQEALRRSDAHGKTGTTSDTMDAWFAGYQHDVVAVVWMGHDTPRKLGDRESGSASSLPIWIDYMTHALKGVAEHEPSPPDGVVQLNGEWFYEEHTPGTGVGSLGMAEKAANAPTEEERKSILDLFRH